jgi:hypothetical protein
MYWLHEIEFNIVNNLAIVDFCNYPSKPVVITVSEVGLPNNLVYAGIIHLEGELFVHLFFDNQRKSVQGSVPMKELAASIADTKQDLE